MSFLFFPGVVLHELAHFFMANLLFVRTGQIEFVPKIHGEKVKLGSVAIAQTDPIRRFFIGIAPILFGLLIMFGVYLLLFPHDIRMFSWQSVVFLYLLFEIGNTMYSSSKDMEGAIGFFILAALFVFFFFVFKLHLPASVIQGVTSPGAQQVFAKMDIFLGIIGVLDGIISWLLKTVTK